MVSFGLVYLLLQDVAAFAEGVAGMSGGSAACQPALWQRISAAARSRSFPPEALVRLAGACAAANHRDAALLAHISASCQQARCWRLPCNVATLTAWLSDICDWVNACARRHTIVQINMDWQLHVLLR